MSEQPLYASAPRLNIEGLRIELIAARFNASVVDRLLQNTLDGLLGSGLRGTQVRTQRVPGAYELPLACLEACKRKPDAIIALGAVIRGETSHYDLIVREVARALMQVMLSENVPIIMGLLTTDNLSQAEKRLDKGKEFAWSALEVIGRRDPDRNLGTPS